MRHQKHGKLSQFEVRFDVNPSPKPLSIDGIEFGLVDDQAALAD
jgi:hypothetical protein